MSEIFHISAAYNASSETLIAWYLLVFFFHHVIKEKSLATQDIEEPKQIQASKTE